MRHLRYLLATILCGLVASGAARAEADFDRWVREFWPAASAEGVSRSTFDAAFAGVTPDPEVLEKAKFQPEFVRPMWDYVASAASEKRVATGRAMLTQHKALLDRIEARYEVDRHTLVAIWGMESSYGEVLADPRIVKSVVRSLATLAWGDPRRAKSADSS